MSQTLKTWLDHLSDYEKALVEVANQNYQERIIKILEEQKNKMLATDNPGHHTSSANMPIRIKTIEMMIDLIKENK